MATEDQIKKLVRAASVILSKIDSSLWMISSKDPFEKFGEVRATVKDLEDSLAPFQLYQETTLEKLHREGVDTSSMSAEELCNILDPNG